MGLLALGVIVRDGFSDHFLIGQFSQALLIGRFLQVHVRNVHIRVRKFKCDQCDKEFVTRYLLQEHAQADHEGMPSHLCPICGKGYTGY